MSSTFRGLDARHLPGPFVIIGDVHGCAYTLDALLRKLGGSLAEPVPDVTLVSVGDLHDKAGPQRGPLTGEPGSVEVLRWAMRESSAGRLVTVDSNHGVALAKYLSGARKIRANPGPGAELTARQILSAPDSDQLAAAVTEYLSSLPVFVRLNSRNGEFVVAHAAASERLVNAEALTERERSFHIRAREFRWHGQQGVVVGHVTVPKPVVTRERRADGSLAGPVIRIDTGADEGGELTAYLPDLNSFLSVPVDPRDIPR